MKENIKKAAISELPVLLKGIGIIIFILFGYYSGIVFADYATGREFSYFEHKPSPTPNPKATTIANGKTSVKTKGSYKIESIPLIRGDYKFKKLLLFKNDSKLAELGLEEKENLGSFFYDEQSDTLFYTVNATYDEIWFIELRKIQNLVNETTDYPTKHSSLYIKKQDRHGLTGISIQGYHQNSETLILSTNSGDGCGGQGIIWIYNTDKQETILKYKSGCMAETGDNNYLTYFDDKILYYKELGQLQDDWSVQQPSDIYALDIETLEESVYLPVEFYPEGTTTIGQSYFDEHTLIFYRDGSSLLQGYDLETRQIVEIQQ